MRKPDKSPRRIPSKIRKTQHFAGWAMFAHHVGHVVSHHFVHHDPCFKVALEGTETSPPTLVWKRCSSQPAFTRICFKSIPLPVCWRMVSAVESGANVSDDLGHCVMALGFCKQTVTNHCQQSFVLQTVSCFSSDSAIGVHPYFLILVNLDAVDVKYDWYGFWGIAQIQILDKVLTLHMVPILLKGMVQNDTYLFWGVMETIMKNT